MTRRPAAVISHEPTEDVDLDKWVKLRGPTSLPEPESVDTFLTRLANRDPDLQALELHLPPGLRPSLTLSQLRSIGELRRRAFGSFRNCGESKKPGRGPVRCQDPTRGPRGAIEQPTFISHPETRELRAPHTDFDSAEACRLRDLTDEWGGPNRPAWSVGIALCKFEATRPRARPTSSLTAYELYLHGMESFRTIYYPHVTPDALRPTQELLRAAIREDPYFAEPRAILATCLVSISDEFCPAVEVLPEAKELASKAAELNPDSSEAHTALGNVAMQADFDWPRAEDEFRRAIALNPSDPAAHAWYSFLLEILQRYRESNRQFAIACALDLFWSLPEFQVLRTRRSAADPMTLMHRCAGLMPEFGDRIGVRSGFAWGCALSGRTQETLASVKPISSASDLASRSARAEALAAMGRVGPVRELARDWEGGRFSEFLPIARVGQWYSLAGDPEGGFEMLDRDRHSGHPGLWYIYEDRAFDPIRKDPRFEEMLIALKLPTKLSRPLVSVGRAK